jgi:hypothetical protein
VNMLLSSVLAKCAWQRCIVSARRPGCGHVLCCITYCMPLGAAQPTFSNRPPYGFNVAEVPTAQEEQQG